MDTVNPPEKRQRRLLKNRESAKKSRKRKKSYLNFLEKRISALSNEASELRQQVYKKETMESNLNLRFALYQGLKLDDTLKSLKTKISSSCKQRQEHIAFLVDEVLDVMIPQHAKLLLLTCQNPDMEVPELNPNQLKVVKEIHPILKHESTKLLKIVNELKKAKEDINEILQ